MFMAVQILYKVLEVMPFCQRIADRDPAMAEAASPPQQQEAGYRYLVALRQLLATGGTETVRSDERHRINA